MNSRDKLVSLAIAGGLLLIAGVWTTSWWTADVGLGAVKVGLREVRTCVDLAPCVSVPFEAAQSFIDADATRFLRYSKIAYFAGLLASVLWFAHAAAIAVRGERRIGIAAAVVSGVCAISLIATFRAVPADLSALTSVSFSPYLAVGGIVLGWGSVIPALIPDAIPARMLAARDKLHRAAVGPLDQRENPPPRAELPTVRMVEDRAVHDIPIRPRRVAPAPAEPVRFAVRDCQIHAHGLVADGGREVSWQRIDRVVMRQLPPEAPFDGQLMLDIVPASIGGERVTPLRLLTSTRVNYPALPGGAAVTAKQNLEKLAELIRDQNPACTLDGAPPRFAVARHFHDYDDQYAPAMLRA